MGAPVTQTPLQALHQRAQAGDADAMALTAVAAALGRGEPASWPEALDRLRRAAKLGSAFAEGQLDVLTQSGLDEPPRQPVASQVLLADPAIRSLPGFLPKAACDWLIRRAAGNLTKAETYDDQTGGRRLDKARNNSMVGFLMKDFDLVMIAVRARIATAIGSASSGWSRRRSSTTRPAKPSGRTTISSTPRPRRSSPSWRPRGNAWPPS